GILLESISHEWCSQLSKSCETSNRTPGFGPVHTGFDVRVQYQRSPTFIIKWSRIEMAVSLVMGLVYLNSWVFTSRVSFAAFCGTQEEIVNPKKAAPHNSLFISQLFSIHLLYFSWVVLGCNGREKQLHGKLMIFSKNFRPRSKILGTLYFDFRSRYLFIVKLCSKILIN